MYYMQRPRNSSKRTVWTIHCGSWCGYSSLFALYYHICWLKFSQLQPASVSRSFNSAILKTNLQNDTTINGISVYTWPFISDSFSRQHTQAWQSRLWWKCFCLFLQITPHNTFFFHFVSECFRQVHTFGLDRMTCLARIDIYPF